MLSKMEEGNAGQPGESTLPPETVELMQSIVLRHNPSDSHHMRSLMTNAGLLSGAYAMAAGLVWWITVAKGGSQLGDSDIPDSLLGLDFSTASIVVPILVLLSTAVFVFGSYRGTPGALLFGGGTALLVAYLTIQPMGLLVVGSIDEVTTALAATARLAVLSLLTYLAVMSGISAILLSWVLGQHHYLPFDVFEVVKGYKEGEDDVSSPIP